MKAFLDKTGVEIEIRSLEPEDEELLKNFYLSLDEKTIYSFYNYHMDRKVLIGKEKIKQECSFDRRTQVRMVAIHNEKIVGLGMLLGGFCTEEASEVGHIIADEYQRRGIGSFLMEELLSQSKDLHLGRYVCAQTSPQNAGPKGLLQKFGFIVKSRDDGEIFWLYKFY